MIVWIQEKTGHSVRAICTTLKLPRSSFYHSAVPTPTQVADNQLAELIEAIFRQHRRRYGYRRINRQLAVQAIHCSPERVRRLMKVRGLRALSTKRFVPKTSDGKAPHASPNRLKDRPFPTRPNDVWTGDITYLPSSEGWLYLAVVIDLFSRRVVGWHLEERMHSHLVQEALKQALTTRGKQFKKLIFHSDRGSQYGSGAFRRQLLDAKIEQSMSAKANPYDNSWTESFMGTLKREMLGEGCFEGIADAKTALFEYIESYYNTKRMHSSLDYQTPSQVERKSLTLLMN